VGSHRRLCVLHFRAVDRDPCRLTERQAVRAPNAALLVFVRPNVARPFGRVRSDSVRNSLSRLQLIRRHAAALALVGWYLMTPPCRTVSTWYNGGFGGGSCFMDSQAPIREWQRVPDTQKFEYKTDCERAISNECHRTVDADGTPSREGDLCGADCIAENDPRLKRK